MMSPSSPGPNVVPCTLKHLLYLCERMREDERDQYVAVTGSKDVSPDVAAVGMFNTPGIKFTVLGPEGYPYASGGAEEVAPGVWQAWMVGSADGWKSHWRQLTRTACWMIDGILKQEGARRVQATCLNARGKSAVWFERALGMQPEGVWRKYGPNGEDVSLFARVAGASA